MYLCLFNREEVNTTLFAWHCFNFCAQIVKTLRYSKLIKSKGLTEIRHRDRIDYLSLKAPGWAQANRLSL